MKQYDAGQFRDSLEIVEEKIESNDMGFEEKSYFLKHRLKGIRLPVSTTEFFGAERNQTSLKYKFVTRVKEVSNLDYILFKEQVYNIRNVYSEVGNPFMEILAEVVE